MIKKLQVNIKTSLETIKYCNQTSKPKYKRKRFEKAAREHTISLTYKFFSHLNFSLSLENSGMKKTTLFSLHSSILFSTQTTAKFFTSFISCLKFTPTKVILKKGLLQYSSLSRKNESIYIIAVEGLTAAIKNLKWSFKYAKVKDMLTISVEVSETDDFESEHAAS